MSTYYGSRCTCGYHSVTGPCPMHSHTSPNWPWPTGGYTYTRTFQTEAPCTGRHCAEHPR